MSMSYNDYSPENLSGFIDLTRKALEAVEGCFDSIVVRGVSGIIVGSPVAHMMGKPIVIVRKPGVSSHAHSLISNLRHVGKRYVIVDDFVSLGRTMTVIQDAIRVESAGLRYPEAPEYAGLYQYAFGSWYQNDPPCHHLQVM